MDELAANLNSMLDRIEALMEESKSPTMWRTIYGHLWPACADGWRRPIISNATAIMTNR